MIQIENLFIFFIEDLDSRIIDSDCQIFAIRLILKIPNCMTKVDFLNLFHLLAVPDNNRLIIRSWCQVLAVIRELYAINLISMIFHLFNLCLIREIPEYYRTIIRNRCKSHIAWRLAYLINKTSMPLHSVF